MAKLLAAVCTQPAARGLFEVLVLEQEPSDHDLKVIEEWLDWHRAEAACADDAETTGDTMRRALARKSGGFRRVKELPMPRTDFWGGTVTSPGQPPRQRSATEYVSEATAGQRPTQGKPCPELEKVLHEWGLAGRDGIIVPERAKGRVRTERGGVPDAAFVDGLVHTESLPTLTANHSDRYYSLKHMRHLSVGELLHTAGDFYEDSPLTRALVQRTSMTAVQAAVTLGKGEHLVNTSYALSQLLGPIPRWGRRGGRKLRYASAFSGIGMSAAALNQHYGGRRAPEVNWEHVFACEKDESLHQALQDAWGPYGLEKENILKEAALLHVTARRFGRVDLLVLTPDCRNFSRRHHDPALEDQADDLSRFHGALRYVREMKPTYVLIENVAEKGCVLPMSAIIGNVRTHRWSRVTLCPWECFGIPTRRKRSYWLGQII